MIGWKEFEPVSLDITMAYGDVDDAINVLSVLKAQEGGAR